MFFAGALFIVVVITGWMYRTWTASDTSTQEEWRDALHENAYTLLALLAHRPAAGAARTAAGLDTALALHIVRIDQLGALRGRLLGPAGGAGGGAGRDARGRPTGDRILSVASGP